MRRGRPSTTALLVAASVLSHGARRGLPAASLQLAAGALRIAARQGSLLAALARHRIGRALLRMAMHPVLPGLAAHHCARKAWIWERLQQITRRGDSQLLWLGVGFDGLGRALQASGHPARIVETDHPDTLALRRRIVGTDAADMRALELPAQLDGLLGLCSECPTTIVCEGMAMYLRPRDVLRLLDALAALDTPPRLLVSALDTTRPGGRGFRRPSGLVRRWLQHQGEPFRWRLAPDRACRQLESRGYAVAALWDGAGYGEYVIDAVHARAVDGRNAVATP